MFAGHKQTTKQQQQHKQLKSSGLGCFMYLIKRWCFLHLTGYVGSV